MGGWNSVRCEEIKFQKVEARSWWASSTKLKKFNCLLEIIRSAWKFFKWSEGVA